MKEFRKPNTSLDAKEVLREAANAPEDYYVIATGAKYQARRNSGRTKCLQTIKELRKPIPLKEYYIRAGKAGFDRKFALQGLGLHHQAKFCAYYLVQKNERGAYELLVHVDNPDMAFIQKRDVTPEGVVPGTVIFRDPPKKSNPKKKATPKEVESKAEEVAQIENQAS